MPIEGPSMGRYDSSAEGWSAVDKVAQFSHAVGRVSGGRGSAILIAVMDSQGQLIDSAAEPHVSHVGGSSGSGGLRTASSPQRSDAGSKHFGSVRSSHESFRSMACSSVTSLGRASLEDDPLRLRDTKQPPLGVLLTTSHVLCTPEEAKGATVTFLDQLGLMTAARLGHDSRPVRVPLRGAYGFVTSAAESNEHSKKYNRSVAGDSVSSRGSGIGVGRGGRPAASNCEDDDDEPDYLLYRCQDVPDEEEVEDIGFTVTFCDVFSVTTETVSGQSSQAPTPLRRVRPGGSAENGGEGGSVTSPQASSYRSFSHGRSWNASSSSSINNNNGGACHGFGAHSDNDGATIAASSFGRQPGSSAAETAQTTALRSNAAANANTLLLVQPLPVPLLLSAIPDVQVGDAHLMITHVNGGRRCYRVQHVAAVHPDYCEYKLASDSDDECSGGPVFSSAGDFIGIQHERGGHSICLLMKSIVRNLFESDLLGMCRSPISEVCVKKREPHSRGSYAGGGSGGGGLYSPAAANANSASPSMSSPSPIATSQAITTTATTTAAAAKPLSQQVPGYEAVFQEFYSGFDSLLHILYAFPHSRQLLKLALENLSQLNYGSELDQMSTIGGVGAILDTIDGYPQDEAIVTGALAAMCRICIYERNLAMFLHLDGVITTMEAMKEYVHQPTVLQWGTYLLVSATDAAMTSAMHCAEVIVQSHGPQLFVNVLRVHGAVRRKSAVRHLQHSRLIRWTCDLIANLVAPAPQRTTLFLREDFLALLLQLMHDYAGSPFLIEGFVHVLCVFVRCFADLDAEAGNPLLLEAEHASPVLQDSPDSRKLARRVSAFLLPADRLVNRQLSVDVNVPEHLARADLASPCAAATDPHKVSFFFFCQAVRGDSENRFLRSLLDICEAAMDAKSALTSHRGRPEGVLLRCFETLRLLLGWGLVELRHRGHRGSRGDSSHGVPDALSNFSPPDESNGSPSATPASLRTSTTSDELTRLQVILTALKTTMRSAYELQAQVAAVEKLVQQQE
ncbi:hypothetical protein NQL31_002215 [Lotmaria passim]